MRAALEERANKSDEQVIETLRKFVEEKTDNLTSFVEAKSKATDERTSEVREKLE